MSKSNGYRRSLEGPRALAAVLCCLTPVLAGATGNTALPPGSEIVARVGGAPIFYSDVSFHDGGQTVNYEFYVKNGRQPAKTAADEAQLDSLRQADEAGFLFSKIRSIIADNLEKSYGITVTAADAAAALAASYCGVDLAVRVKSMNDQGAKWLGVADALDIFYAGKDSLQAVYDKHLKGDMSFAEWTTDVNKYNTQDSRIRFRTIASHFATAQVADLERVIPAHWALARGEKLQSLADAQIAKTDPSFVAMAAHVASFTASASDTNRVESEREAWWTARFRSAGIVILSARYQAVYGMLGIAPH